ncbi:MAG: TIGR03943 family protein [Cyanobacteria bacterium P01_H01_bin.121]
MTREHPSLEERRRLRQRRREYRRDRRRRWQWFGITLLDSFTIVAWGALLLHYWLGGDLGLLIHPAYRWLTIGAGIVLIVTGLGVLWSRLRSQTKMPEALQMTWWRQLSLGILLSVAITGYVAPLRAFTSDLAFQRSSGDFMTLARAQPQTFRVTQNPGDRAIIDWVRTLNVYPEPDAYLGDPVNVSGFAIHSPDLPVDQMMIAQFVITCCAADVYPVGLPVLLPGDRAEYPQDQWFEVSGEMVVEETSDERRLVIAATDVQPIPEPEDPYAY